MVNVLLVAMGGALGAVMRYAVSGLALRVLGAGLPYGTIAVNLAGSLGAGLIVGAFGNLSDTPAVRAFLLIGLLGGFTTFSAFSLETVSLFREGETRLAFVNILLNNVLGIGLAFLGYAIAKMFRG